MEGISMSVKNKPFVMVDKEVMYRSDLSPQSRVFFSGLLHYDRGRGCWASRTTLSRLTGLSEYHIRESIKELVEVGLITETRRGQGKTNIINIVSMSGDQIEEDTETVEELEPKSVEVSPIYSNKETSEGDLVEKDRIEGYNETEQEEVKSPYHEEETVLRSITTRFRRTERPLIPDCVVLNSTDTEITLYIPLQPIRDYVKDYHLPLIENIVGKKVILSGSRNDYRR